MTTKHTPGPWDVQNKGTLGTRSARHEVVAGINVDGSKNRPTICRMPDLSERSYANARLIAAAPELAEALRDVTAELGELLDQSDNQFGRSNDPTYQAARALLSRIEKGE